MPTPRLPMRKIREVLRLKHDQGLSHRAVARACSLGVGTVTLYLQRATDRGVSWPVPAELDDAVLEARLFPRAAPLRDRVRPDCAEIHRELTRIGVTLLLLWQLNDRPMQQLGVSRRTRYARLDRPALQPLPATRYVLAHWTSCRVNIDYHVQERHLYSVPYQSTPRSIPTGTATASSARSIGSGAGASGRPCARCTASARRPSSTSRASGRRSSIGTPVRSDRSICSSPSSARAATPTPRRRRPSRCPTGSAPTPGWSNTSGARASLLRHPRRSSRGPRPMDPARGMENASAQSGHARAGGSRFPPLFGRRERRPQAPQAFIPLRARAPQRVG